MTDLTPKERLERIQPAEMLIINDPTLLDLGVIGRVIANSEGGRVEAWSSEEEAWITGFPGLGLGNFMAPDSKPASSSDMDEVGLPESERSTEGDVIPNSLA